MKYNERVYTLSSDKELRTRADLFNIFLSLSKKNKIEAERNSGLFLRSSLLARFLAINEIYQKILNLPGVICDFGTWYGQNAIILENLRAINEPNNIDRTIHSFDTFKGYQGFSNKDFKSNGVKNNSYKINIQNYEKSLLKILDLQQKINQPKDIILNHQVYKGDCRKTIKKFLRKDNYPISMAFFDLNSHNATFSILKQISKFFIKGSILVFFQFQRNDINGERKALMNFLKSFKEKKINISKYYKSISYIEL